MPQLKQHRYTQGSKGQQHISKKGWMSVAHFLPLPIIAKKSIVPALLGEPRLWQGPPTYLAGGHHISVLGVLVHCEAEDVVGVFQVEALAPWERDMNCYQRSLRSQGNPKASCGVFGNVL